MPNVLVICSDQHHPAFTGYRGHPWVKTPHLDRLAASGATFTRAYCNSPVCTPSRMSFITGKHVHQIGSWMIGVPLDPGEMTWARRLDQAGIPATMLGKMDFCGPYQDGGFTEHRIIERRPAWDPYPRTTPWDARLRGYTRADKRAHLVNAGPRADAVTDGHRGHDDRLGFYDHDRIVKDWALEYLREKGGARQAQQTRQAQGAATDEPWALYVGLLYPHWPFTVPREYYERYFPDRLDLPPDARFPNPDLHPPLQHFQRALNLGEVTEDMLRRTIAAYQGMITCMDDMIGEILTELADQGLAADTYVIYTSDHGESLGEHGLFYKQCSYEGSVGVPLIVAGPGVPSGGEVARPVSLVDLFPTVMEMAGLPPEPDLPGSSWLPLARGEAQARPEHVFAEYHGNFFTTDWYMVANAQAKLTWYVGERPTLFDLHADPGELHDVAGDPAYAQLRAELETVLRDTVDPDAVAMRARRDLGLIGDDGQDYTESLTVAELEAGRASGRFLPEPTRA